MKARGGYVALAALAGIVLGAGSVTAAVGPPLGEVLQPVGDGSLSVFVGQSQIIKPPFPAARVSVTDPTVADVEVLTPDQLLVLGKKPGATDLVTWSQDEKVWRTRIDVGIDVSRLKADLGATFPGAELTVSQVQNVVVVGGQLRRAEDAGHLKEFMEATKLPYLNRTSLAGIQQVQLQVRVAEVSRQALRTLGFNTYFSDKAIAGGIAVGASSGGPIQPVSISPSNITATISPSVTVFGGFWNGDVATFVQALSENQYLRTLAEPSLNCLSGEEANFLAGGEFPIPVVQGAQGGASNTGTSITIEYKSFGVNLKFKPLVLGDNTIRLMVAPEVSDLSDVGAVEIQGFRIPSVLTRRAETTLELKSGQTFALAGLINRRVDARNSRVPGFGDLPIIGALFRSVRYNQGDTELLIMVTANLVSPDTFVGRPALPGDLHNPPNDWELFATGKLEGANAPALASADAKWVKEQGLDHLRGPGAWAEYSAAPASSSSGIRPEPPPPHTPPPPPPAEKKPEAPKPSPAAAAPIQLLEPAPTGGGDTYSPSRRQAMPPGAAPKAAPDPDTYVPTRREPAAVAKPATPKPAEPSVEPRPSTPEDDGPYQPSKKKGGGEYPLPF